MENLRCLREGTKLPHGRFTGIPIFIEIFCVGLMLLQSQVIFQVQGTWI